jgi:hypothetical protein
LIFDCLPVAATAALVALLSSASLARAQVVAPVGDEMAVNTFTTGSQSSPSVAGDASGNFIVVWESRSTEGGVPDQDGSASGVVGRIYGNNGDALTA